MSKRSEEEQAPDDLRRRLYAPGATAEDVARFEAARVATAVEAEVDPPAPRRPVRWILGGAAITAVLVLGTVLAVVRSVAPVATSTPRDPGGGAVDHALLVPQSARSGFVRALTDLSPAGILPYLEAHPDVRPAPLRTLQRAASTEYSGEGTTTVDLSPSALAEQGGHLTVIVVAAEATTYRWSATRMDPAATGPVPAVATHSGTVPAGGPVSATFAYGRGAPSELTLVVPGETRWGLVVVLSD